VLAAPVLAAGWVLAHQGVLVDGVGLMLASEKGWLALAVAAVAARWLAGAWNLQGAVRERLPWPGLLGAQLAGTFANQFMPLGLGANGVDARFLRRCGLPMPKAVAAVAVSVAAGFMVNALLLAAVIAIAGPSLMPRIDAPHDLVVGVALGLSAIAATAAGLVARRRRRNRREPGRRIAALRVVVADLVDVMRSPSRAVMLWGGSAAQKILPAVVFLAVLRGLQVTEPTTALLGAYFVAGVMSGLIPAPGGIGSLELVLGMTLNSVGVPAASAVAGVFGYRLLTSWLPVLPAGAAFVILVRRNAL
jgi:uncharacterized membrane protein YbhN (UPF0104 family)